jgi:hypothetical protein
LSVCSLLFLSFFCLLIMSKCHLDMIKMFLCFHFGKLVIINIYVGYQGEFLALWHLL